LHQRCDGRLGVEGWLDTEHGSLARALIKQLAARRPDRHGVPDTRTLPQRHADALPRSPVTSASFRLHAQLGVASPASARSVPLAGGGRHARDTSAWQRSISL